MPIPDLRVKSLLVIGGARSGKSTYAQKLAEDSGLQPVLIATAQAYDAEMTERIAKHKAARDGRWRTIEEPVALRDVLRQHHQNIGLMVVDCLTLWLSNLLLRDADIEAAIFQLLETVKASIGTSDALHNPVIFVSNEVGQGIVPDNVLARKFRDYQGSLNQSLAEACDSVILMSAGLPLQLKPRAAPEIHF